MGRMTVKNKQYPLNIVPKISNLKELVLNCANAYKHDILFQYEINGSIAKISFIDFMDDVNSLGTALNKLVLIGRAKVALIGEYSYNWILSYFAVANGGNTIIPIESESIRDEIIYDSEVSCLIYSKKNASKIKKSESGQQHIVLESDIKDLISKGRRLIDGGDRGFIDFVVHDEQCCAILYTSGTTSQPKGVMLSHKNIATNAVASIKNVHFSGASILVLPLYHSFSFTAGVLCVMLSGRTISINNNIKELKDDLIKYQPQNLVLVPMIVEALYKQIWIRAKKIGKESLLKKLIFISNALLKIGIDLRKKLFSSVHNSFGGNLDLIISGGAPIQEKYIKGFRAFGITVLNGYGITECSPVISVNRNHYFRYNSVGQVLCGIDIIFKEGEIMVKGDTVTAGYYRDELQTDESFHNGWFMTGDLGYMDEDGFLYITGRKKNLIVLSSGKNISPEELEERLYDLEYVKEAVVYQNGDQIEAEIYCGGEDIDKDNRRIKEDINRINGMLPIYKNISRITVRETEFPKTATNKIRRSKI